MQLSTTIKKEIKAGKHRNIAGRKSVLTDGVLEKLHRRIADGQSIKEACVELGIHPTTMYKHMQANPRFKEDYRSWVREKMGAMAEKNIEHYLKKRDKDITKFVASRLLKRYYSEATEKRVSGSVGHYIIKEDNKITPQKEQSVKQGATVS